MILSSRIIFFRNIVYPIAYFSCSIINNYCELVFSLLVQKPYLRFLFFNNTNREAERKVSWQ
ncbi:hypothetical protein BFAG_04461 [Bacteroides fragilis 3_1_12]|uniref:Uncharacterized protein n=1 Tax=Bacteroides fragilis 3_1_12 TaxID=457424 RepID=A0ABN0BSJ0_BACFG|nr:hypothetical protein BFAG_04461 [Bacteroides fragilis 3_1_12]